MQWLFALALAVYHDQRVRRAFAALLAAIAVVVSAHLGLGALLPSLGQPQLGLWSSPLLSHP